MSRLTKTWEPIMSEVEQAYYRDLVKDISQVVFSSTDRLSEMRKCLPTMKDMKLCRLPVEETFYRSYLLILLAECKDSQFVMDFVETCGRRFNSWLIMDNDDVEIVNYVLHHAQKMKLELYSYNLYSDDECPVSKSLFRGKVKCAIPLLKYEKLQYPTRSEEVQDYFRFSRWCRSYATNHAFKSELPLLRQWLLLQLIHTCVDYIFNKNTDPLHVLILIWRSIPEPFLTRPEIEEATKWCAYTSFLPRILKLYQDNVVCSKDYGDVIRPRSLRQLTRCVVRKRLAENFAVPDGIDDLPLAMPIRDFLRMDC